MNAAVEQETSARDGQIRRGSRFDRPSRKTCDVLEQRRLLQRLPSGYTAAGSAEHVTLRVPIQRTSQRALSLRLRSIATGCAFTAISILCLLRYTVNGDLLA